MPSTVAKLRQVDVLVSQGQTVAEAIRAIGVTEVTYDELLDGEIFYTLREAEVVTGSWRRHLYVAPSVKSCFCPFASSSAAR